MNQTDSTLLRKCCRRCRDSAPGKFCFWCLAQSAAFPLEHFVWERLPVLRWVTLHLGLA